MTGRMQIDWEAAFSFYAALGVARSYVKVAQRFDVSETAVRKHAAKFGWEERIAKIDAEARRQTDARVLRSRDERIERTLELVDLARDELLERLRLGEADVRLADVPGLVKLEALLQGDPTDRVAVGEVEAFMGSVLQLTRAVLEEALVAGGLETRRTLVLEFFDRELPSRVGAFAREHDAWGGDGLPELGKSTDSGQR